MQSGQQKLEGEDATRSVARYYALQYHDNGTVLMCGDDAIFNTQTFSPAEWLKTRENTSSHVILHQSAQRLLIVGTAVPAPQETYSFYEVEDITQVYSSIYAMALQFVLIDLTVIALTAVLSVWLVGKTLAPLEHLKESTRTLTAGNYEERIAVQTDDEIGALARDFNLMADAVEHHVAELKQDAQRQTMLLSALTHELKTPLTGIKGNAETLLMTQMSEEEQQEALIYIDDECTRVERLSQKLMQLISLREQGALTLKDCLVDDLLEQVRISCAEQLRQRKLTLNIENSMERVMAEPDLLVSLLLNLIDNAGKASKPGDEILLTATGNCICVQDHGQGIPAEALDKITQPFYMVDKSRARRAGGIGLGLALAQEIAQLHGAELIFESQVGVGTTAKLIFHP